jgi:hypothetical protein
VVSPSWRSVFWAIKAVGSITENTKKRTVEADFALIIDFFIFIICYKSNFIFTQHFIAANRCSPGDTAEAQKCFTVQRPLNLITNCFKKTSALLKVILEAD